MPKYTFVCENCGERTEFSWMLAEYDAAIKKAKCYHCKCKKIHRDYQTDDINCKVKEIKTIGQLAEANTRKNKNKINEQAAKESEQKLPEKKPWYHSQGKATAKEINKMSEKQKIAYIMRGEL
jgi:hypothetical protein